MTTLLADLRHALRVLWKTPGVSLVIVLTLALGIGAIGAIFSVIDTVLLEPLAYEEPEELVQVHSKFPTMDFDHFWISPPEYHELAEWSRSYESLGAYRTGEFSLVGADRPMRVNGAVATASLFETLGVAPRLGRVFEAGEDVPDGPAVVVVSSELWQRALGGDEDVVGSTITVDGTPSTVVGVMPPGFDVEDAGIDLWVPAQLDPADRTERRGNHFLWVIARLADGVSFESAQSELASLVEDWGTRAGQSHTPSPQGHPLGLRSLKEELIGDTRPALMALLGAVLFVLLIACANVANLLLARSETRQKEMAVRAAMGASRARLVRQVLTESVLIAVVAAALGVALAHWGLRAILAAYPGSLPRAGDVSLDWTVLLWSGGVAILTGVLFGLAPALQLSARRFGDNLKEGGHRSSAGGAQQRLRKTLVVAEIALALALVVGAGLMIRSLSGLLRVDPGFDTSNLTSFQLYLPSSEYPDARDQMGFYDRLLERIRALPGVESAAAVRSLPPVMTLDANDTAFEGIERDPEGPPHNTDYWQYVTLEAEDALQLRLLSGRFFEPADDAQGTPVVLVSKKTAETFWPGQDPLGRRLRPGFRPNGQEVPWFTIVGVVDDVRQNGLDQEPGTQIYWSYEQLGALAGLVPRTMHVVTRSSLDHEAIAQTLREQVWAIDASLPVADLTTLETVVRRSVSRPRLLTLLLGLFGAIALFLAAVGIYGVLSYSVAERGQEMGIRMALGADRRSILGLVLGDGLRLALLGIVVGIGLSFVVTRLLGTLLFEVEPTDPLTWLAVLVFLAAVALVACAVPALRATRVHPLRALRYE